MYLICNNKELHFEKIKLTFVTSGLKNVFASKNNKTLEETIEHKRYLKFRKTVIQTYEEYLNWNLGDFLFYLKQKNDPFYQLFLNKYGDLTFSQFFIDDEKILNKKGLYSYMVDDKLKYIGRCRDSFKKRVNQGYGKIAPKNCFIDGQSTNCHLNALITEYQNKVSFYVCEIDDVFDIVESEEVLIRQLKPSWNIAMKN